jgi:hypothetical protein
MKGKVDHPRLEIMMGFPQVGLMYLQVAMVVDLLMLVVTIF